ncbi:MAG: hypothetical protein DMG68_06605 [Acidobacteria bacterium]|jgi:hypothetical protein|nr:MAG: hypothetical protein DMG68_06605 [Acidobacteriota bacterium]
MTCSEFHEILPDMLEHEAAGRHAAHLQSCSSCSSLVADLKAISEGARLLAEADEPSPRIWANIQRTLEAEGIIRAPQQEGGILFPRRRWSIFIWAAPVLAVFVLVAGFFLRAHNAGNISQPVSLVAQPGNIADNDEQQVLAALAPAIRANYEDNLKSVDAFIQDAKDSLAQNPDDDEARHFLMQAYEQKAMVYQLAMDRSAQ